MVPASRKASRPSVGAPGAEPAEVLIVDEDVLAAGPDQVGVVRVDAVGDDADLDAGPVSELIGSVHVSSPRAPSGSTSGWDGLLGQICCGALDCTCWCCALAGKIGPAPAAPRGEVPPSRQGRRAWTARFAL